jgi:hypothetical protein
LEFVLRFESGGQLDLTLIRFLAGALNIRNALLANPLIKGGDHIPMTEHHTERRIEKTATEARAGVSGHNVRYVLAASLMGVVIFFAGLLYFWAA